MEKIDFVVTWLDSSDPEWIEQYNNFRKVKLEGDKARFRNWGFFKYWFRAVEQYAPWVNKVFLVTNGKFPDWINQEHPKLVLVKHSDFIPSEYLPTFNVRTIELNLHRIPGISECFVNFNDDMYLNSPVSPKNYFVGGLPCDNNRETLFTNTVYDPISLFSNRISLYCDVAVLNYHFKRKDVIMHSFRRWLGPHLGLQGIFFSLQLILRGKFEGFSERHTEMPILRSSMEDMWEKEPEMLHKSCTKFRNDISLNSSFIRYWQFAQNKFHPVKHEDNKKDLSVENLPIIRKMLTNKKISSVCLNDTPRFPESDFSIIQQEVLSLFEKKFPNKSDFEI